MTNGRPGLTSYLSAALRLRGPGCERAFLAHEARALLRGAHPEDMPAVRNVVDRDDGPEPPRLPALRRPAVLRIARSRAA